MQLGGILTLLVNVWLGMGCDPDGFYNLYGDTVKICLALWS